jgi:hypothetical protein
MKLLCRYCRARGGEAAPRASLRALTGLRRMEFGVQRFI